MQKAQQGDTAAYHALLAEVAMRMRRPVHRRAPWLTSADVEDMVRLEGERFIPVAQLDGVSNHRIGESFITGGLRDCGARPELLLPSADWHWVTRVRLSDRRLSADDPGPLADAHLFQMLAIARGDGRRALTH